MIINNSMPGKKRQVGRLQKSLLALIAAAVVLGVQAADPVTQAVDTTIQSNKASAASQQKVGALDDQTRALLDRYRSALWQTQQMNVYARQLEQLTAGQDAERDSLQRQINEVERTERELMPLMLRMVETLEKFIALDLPFLKSERQERVAALKKLMTDPGSSVAEKYRRILEAYQIEADYGRSLGVERAEVDNKTVDILRVGRTELYSLDLDGGDGAYWDAKTAKWLPLKRSYLGSVKKGIKIARETAAADLLILPMPAATGAAP